MSPSRLLVSLALFLALAGLAALWWTSQTAPPPSDPTLTLDEPFGRSGTEAGTLTSGAGDQAVALDDETTLSQTPRSRRSALAFLSGQVLDESARGIPGARVEAFPIDADSLRGAPYADGPAIAQTETDREGAFRLPVDAAGWLRVVASAPGKARVGQRVAGTGLEVRFVLPDAALLDVEVVDTDGRPVAEALVEVQVQESQARERTDASGRASFATLPPGAARLRVGADAHGTVSAGPSLLQTGARSHALVILPRGVSLAGIVRDAETGSPLAGARIHIARPGHAEAAEPTGSDGRFGPLDAGGLDERVFVAAAAEGYAPALVPVVLGAQDTLEIEVGLTQAAPWTGSVVDAQGRAVAGASVGYTADGIAGRAPATTTTDARGAFSLPPPPPPAPGRRVVLHAERDGAEAALALRPGSVAPDPLVLTLQTLSVVRGRVVDGAGAPRAGVEVRLNPAWDEVRTRGNPDARTSLLLLANERGLAGLSGASDASGVWMVDGVAPGTWQVRYRWSTGSRWREALLVVEGRSVDAGTEALGSGGRLSGRVLGRSGEPVAGAELRLAPTEDSRRAQRATSGPDGWYEFLGLGPGSYRLRASLGALSPVESQVTVSDDAEQRSDIQFDAGTTLSGRVLGPEGEPFSGILRVSLQREGSPRPDRAPHGVRVQKGALEIENLPSGRWIIDLRGPAGLEGRAGPLDIDPGRTSTLTITLVRSHPVRGTVVTSAGRPSPGATVGLTHEESARHQLATCDANGLFAFEALSPGTWAAEIRGPGGAPATATVEVQANAATTLRLALLPGGSARVRVEDERGRPVVQALVLFRGPDGSLATRTPARTDRTGEVQVDDLPVERLVVSVRSLDGRRGADEVYIAEGETRDVRVRVQPVAEPAGSAGR